MLGKTKRVISVTMALCMLMTLFAVSLPVRAAGLANRFYQSQLNSAEKEVYSKLDSIAQDYFQNKTNATEVSYNNKTYYRTNTITCAASFSQEDLQKIVAYYLWENPIYYYFMDGGRDKGDRFFPLSHVQGWKHKISGIFKCGFQA